MTVDQLYQNNKTSTFNVDVRDKYNTLISTPSHLRGYDATPSNMTDAIVPVLLKEHGFTEALTKKQVSNFLNALSLAQRLFPQGGQISCGGFLITYGESLTETPPNFEYDDYDYLENEQKVQYESFMEDGLLDPEMTLDEFVENYTPIDGYMNPIIEGFMEFLSYYYNDNDFLYQANNGVVYVSDDKDSVENLVYLLNDDTTRGHKYNNDFVFDASRVLATVTRSTTGNKDMTDAEWIEANQTYFELLQKMAIIDIRNSGYDWNAVFSIGGYTSSIVADFYKSPRFFELYLVDYGYADAFSLDLTKIVDKVDKKDRVSITQHELELSYYLTCQMLEVGSDKSEAIYRKHQEQYHLTA